MYVRIEQIVLTRCFERKSAVRERAKKPLETFLKQGTKKELKEESRE